MVSRPASGLRVKRLLILLYALSVLCTGAASQRVRIGAEVLLEKHLDLLKDRSVGIVCNQASVFPDGTHLADSLLRLGVAVKVLFSPEHGIRAQAAAGAGVGNQTDSATGLPVYSLYGKTLKPTPEMLHGIDLMIIDLQDVGARFYTYASTMANVMEAGRDFGKKIIVLDRPNPINGLDVEGPVLDMTLISFLGLFPIPVRHGLTLGELATIIVAEGWLNYNSAVDLTVIPMEGWRRSMWFDQTGLPWVPPSPNMKTLATAIVYPGTCLLEATGISEGRGTPRPFEYAGAPNLNSRKAASMLNGLHLPGVVFAPVTFTPKPDPIAAPDPKFKNELCDGIQVRVTDRKKFHPVLAGVMMLAVLHELSPRKFQLMQGRLDHLIGDTIVGEKLMKGSAGKNILDAFQGQIEQFKKLRSRYLLYR
jgi:uncharacterized protein YbbC (DUF1343 family)